MFKQRVFSIFCGLFLLTATHVNGQNAFAEFSFTQCADTISFESHSQYADSLTWNYANGVSEFGNHQNPRYIYGMPGYYPVRLIAFNKTNGSRDTMIHYVEVRGIQRVESNRGGNDGKVTISIIGFVKNASYQAKLRLGTTEIAALESNVVSSRKMEATFDLAGATPGQYDVVVQYPFSGEEMSLAKGFTVEEAVEPNVWVDIQGMQQVITGNMATYTVLYGNTGNTDAENRIIWIVTPDDPAEITFTNINLNDYGLYSTEIKQFILQNNLQPYLKSTDIDPSATPARYYGICVPAISANSERLFTFTVKSTEDFEIQAFHTYGYLEDELLSNGQQATAENFNDCFYEQLGSYFGNYGDRTNFVNCSKDMYSNVLGDYPQTYNNYLQSLQTASFRTLEVAEACGKGGALPDSTTIKMASVMLDAGFHLVHPTHEFDAQCGKFRHRGDKKLAVSVNNSFNNFNEKQGPAGYSEENFVAQRVFPYTIFFENIDADTVRELVITDTLDAQKFDLSTFRFTEFGFGGNRYTIYQDDNKFANNIDLRPAINSLLRVTGILEDSIVTWRFRSFDSKMKLTEDIAAGFLPPNLTSPQGEGFVSFAVNLKETVGNGEVISNFADIAFDANVPIRTQVFSNKMDKIAPESQVLSANYNPSTLEIDFTFSGTDAGGTGIKYYDLYVSTNGSAFVPMFKNISGNTFSYIPSGSGTYSFYSIATDSLTNRENTKSVGEASLNYVGIKTVKIDALRVYPNPVNYELRIMNYKTIENVEIYDVVGQLLYQINKSTNNQINNEISIDVSHLAAGMYFLKVDNNVVKFVKE